MRTTQALQQRYAELLESFRIGRVVTLVFILNVVLYCLGHWILGGSALLAEGYEGESWLRPWSGDEFRVSAAVGWYSLLHGMSVFFSLPVIPISALMLAYEWAKLQRVRRRLSVLD